MGSTSTQVRLALEPPPAAKTTPADTSTRTSTSAPLSERLHRFWTERGDFSKFTLEDLVEDAGDVGGDAKRLRAGDGDGKATPRIDWGVVGGEQKYTDEVKALTAATLSGGGKETSPAAAAAAATTPLTIEEFVQLKEEMMGRLHYTQQSLYSSQALVALLVASNKTRTGGASEAVTRAASVAPAAPPTSSQSRTDSPAPGGSAAPAPPPRHPPGSIAAVEAEFGLDPYSVALTSIERRDEFKENTNDDGGGGGGGDVGAARMEFSNDAQRDEYIARMHSSVAAKRRHAKSAISILRQGARSLNDSGGGGGVDGGEQQDSPADDANVPSSSTPTPASRWSALRQAQRLGWGLTPGRPGTAIGSSTRPDEGEQDAWVGYGVPESRAVYRRNALAYFGGTRDGDSDNASAATPTFVARRNKRLRVDVVAAGEGVAAGEDANPTTRTFPLKSADGHGDTAMAALSAAQSELIDCELFDEVRNQARVLASMGVVECKCPTDGLVVVELGDGVEVRFELVSSGGGGGGEEEERRDGEGEGEAKLPAKGTAVDDEGKAKLPAKDYSTADDEGKAKDVAQGSILQSVSTAAATATEFPSSALSSRLLLAAARLSLVKTYQARADAEKRRRLKHERERLEAQNRRGGGVKKPVDENNANTNKNKPKPVVATPTAAAATTTTPAADPWQVAPFLMPLLSLLHYISVSARGRQVENISPIGMVPSLRLGKLFLHWDCPSSVASFG